MAHPQPNLWLHAGQIRPAAIARATIHRSLVAVTLHLPAGLHLLIGRSILTEIQQLRSNRESGRLPG